MFQTSAVPIYIDISN